MKSQSAFRARQPSSEHAPGGRETRSWRDPPPLPQAHGSTQGPGTATEVPISPRGTDVGHTYTDHHSAIREGKQQNGGSPAFTAT